MNGTRMDSGPDPFEPNHPRSSKTRGGGSENGGRALGDLVTSMLKLWPILSFLAVQTIGTIAWGVSIERRIPAEVPPVWFEKKVEEIRLAVEKVDEKVDENGKAIAKLDGRVEALQKTPRFNDG